LRSTRKIAAVLSADYKKAYPVLRSLKKHGYDIVAVFRNWRSYVLSRFIDHRLRIVNVRSPKDMEILLRYLKVRYGAHLVIPISFEDYLYMSKIENPPLKTIKIGNVDLASDKFELGRICSELGVSYPKTMLLKIDDVDRCVKIVEAEIGYPAVIKGRGDAARPSYVSDRDDLREALRSRNKMEVLVQEYVPGIGCGYFAIAVEGRPLVEYTHVRLIEEKASGGPSVASRLDFDIELIEIGRRFLSYFKWTGPVMVEMKRHVETGEIYIIEVNPKFWGSLELSYASGLDLTCELLKTCGEEVTCVHKVYRGNMFYWIIASMHYLRENIHVYLSMLKNVLKRGILHVSDIHVDDPPELFYGVTTRAIAVLSGKFRRSAWREKYHDIIRRKIARALKTLRLIIFDLDGTLVDIPLNWSRLKDQICARTGRSRTFNVMSLIAKDRGVDKEVRKIEIEAAKEVAIDDDTIRLIDHIRRLGIYTALATKQCREAAYTIIENSKAENLFNMIMTRDDELFKKDQVKKILTKLDIKPEETTLIGDSIVDYYAACKNSTRFIAVTRSLYRTQMFIELNVPCIRDVKILLKMLVDLLEKNVHSTNT